MNITDLYIKYLLSLSIKDFNKKYKFLGEGISRKVYALNDTLVIKVAKGEDGYLQNFVEHYVYTKADDEFKKYLCPVVFYSKNILIMFKANPYINLFRKPLVDFSYLRDEKNVEDDIIYLGKKFKLFIEDLYSPSSWGYINDEYYLIDYGCTSDEGDVFYETLMAFTNI